MPHKSVSLARIGTRQTRTLSLLAVLNHRTIMVMEVEAAVVPLALRVVLTIATMVPTMEQMDKMWVVECRLLLLWISMGIRYQT